MGKLVPRKGVDTLIEAMGILARRPGGAPRLVAAGIGEMREPLERRAAELGVADRIHWAGKVAHDEVGWWMSAGDLFVLPSLSEGLPTVVCEAMNCGLPVVATAVDGTPEIVRDGVTGLLVPPSQPEPLAAALGRILDDPGARGGHERRGPSHRTRGVHLGRQRAAHDRDLRGPPLSAPVAVVLQASGPNALGIVRSLGRAGVRVIACDHDPRALGLLSRYVTPAHTADPLTEPDRFVDDLLALGRGEAAGGVLFPTHDEAIATIGPREAEVDAVLARPWSPWGTMQRIIDKGHQHAAARAIGFPVPETIEPEDDADIVAAAAALRFPMILKPRYAPEFRRRFRVQVLEANDGEELRRQWELAAPYRPQLSEVIPGGDDLIWTLGVLPRRRRAGPSRPSPAASCASGRRASAPPAPPRPTGTRTSRPGATPCWTSWSSTGSPSWRRSATRATAATTSSRSTPAPGSGWAWRPRSA